MAFDIVLDHPDLVVAYKPPGVSFHSEQEAGFVVQLEAQLNAKLYSVHRLDKVTSGLLVFGKTSEAAAALTALFEARAVDKYYLALIDCKPKKKQGWVKGDMAKSRRGTYKLLKSLDNPAVTRFYTAALQERLRAVILKPFSGKTHQLRVALKSLASPILGDESYGGTPADRTYLHALCLRFVWQGEQIHCYREPKEGQWFSQYLQSDIHVVWQNPNELEW